MQRTEMIEQLRTFFIEQVLDGKDIGLDETTPLLEWGILNSLEMMRLLGFIRRQFGIEIPASQMVADNFVDIRMIADMIEHNQHNQPVAAAAGAEESH
jgi:acyl carrier protein